MRDRRRASRDTDFNVAPQVQQSFAVAPRTYTLTVLKSGAGEVTSSPGGISCGSVCSHAYTAGSLVKLTAKAAAGSRFAGWSGPCTGTGTYSVTMTAAKRVTASFAVIRLPAGTTSGYYVYLGQSRFS